MHAMTIRKIDDEMKQHLAARAASNQRSMEAEARSILRAALVPVVEENMADIALSLFGREYGFDLPETPRSLATGAIFEQ